MVVWSQPNSNNKEGFKRFILIQSLFTREVQTEIKPQTMMCPKYNYFKWISSIVTILSPQNVAEIMLRWPVAILPIKVLRSAHQKNEQIPFPFRCYLSLITCITSCLTILLPLGLDHICWHYYINDHLYLDFGYFIQRLDSVMHDCLMQK